MKHWTTYPLIAHPYNPEFVSGEGLARFSRAAEAAGFDGIAFTDHPAPSDKWLNAGGHDALDPFAALPYVAAVTERIRLIPNIVVLPYRNPFHVAKSAATIDVLSGGRFTLSVATGYLRSEYRALGVDFEQRNALFEEALEAMRGVWSTDQYSFEGSGYTAKEISVNPKPGHV
ncbi:MAG TPA: TIGR03619 family F420-dependent LLM class oxidoreductase, partial [Acidimicrobiia bacterium]|nr:TIGR03619 family F420-dependent LLM class oxidoreductase [Acidimicrobiia bacterium]